MRRKLWPAILYCGNIRGENKIFGDMAWAAEETKEKALSREKLEAMPRAEMATITNMCMVFDGKGNVPLQDRVIKIGVRGRMNRSRKTGRPLSVKRNAGCFC